MDLLFSGKYVKDFEKYSDKIIQYFCNGLLCKEISNKLYEECGVKIPYQSITIFYKNNRDYIRECKKSKQIETLNEIVRENSIEYAKAILTEILLEAEKTLIKDWKKLDPDIKIKLIPTVTNSLAKLEGLDKSEININNNPSFEDFFDEDIIEDAINDYESKDEESD